MPEFSFIGRAIIHLKKARCRTRALYIRKMAEAEKVWTITTTDTSSRSEQLQASSPLTP